jgi:hypothetical protein
MGEQPASEPILLSGGNPQIPKGYGDEPVQAYIAAMPGWKSAVGARIDALVTGAIPKEHSWFLSLHCFTRYIKVAFLNGALLHPTPPVPSKSGATRYLHIHENDAFDEAQFIDWITQASRLPGEKL